MAAVPILVANAVAAAINAAESDGDFAPLEFEAERRYADWDDELKELKGISVDVVFTSHQSSGGGKIELESVGSLEYAPSIDIVVRKKFGDADRGTDRRFMNASVDPLVLLVQQLHELFVGQRNAGFNATDHGIDAHWLDSDAMSWIHQWKLRQAGLFEGVVRIQFTASKAVPSV